MEKVLNKRQIGSKYEELAAAYLVKKGYKIIEKNYHARRSAVGSISMRLLL